jgi:hypothetical protein
VTSIVPAGTGFTLTVTVDSVAIIADTTVTLTIVDAADASSVTATLILDVAPFSTLAVIPTVQTLAAASITPGLTTAVYTILGGSGVAGNFIAFSDNPGLVSITSIAGSPPVLTVTVDVLPLVDTTVTFTIFDSDGSSVTAQLIIDIAPLATLAVIPAAQTIDLTGVAPVVPVPVVFTIIGGSGGYTAFSGNPGLVSITSVAGNTLTVSVDAVPSTDTTVDITIFDSVGSSVTASVVLDVGSDTPLAVSPTTIAITAFDNPETVANPADNVTFIITGGTGPYNMFSNNDALILSQPGLGGNTFSIEPDGVAVSTTVTLTVEDALGDTVTASVTLLPPVSVLGLNPATISLFFPDTVTFYILGGFGPYDLFTSDGTCTIPFPLPPLPATATSFTLLFPGPCLGASVTITIQDNLGDTATSTITVN